MVSIAVCHAGDPKLMAECAQELSVTNAEGIVCQFLAGFKNPVILGLGLR